MKKEIKGYQIDQIIKESSSSIIYKGIRLNDQKPVAIKTLQEEYPTRQQIARLQHEFELHSSLNNIPGVAQAYEMLEFDNKPAFVMEFVPGGELTISLLAEKHSYIDKFFTIALQITQTLGEIHQQYIIHKDINPHNIMWDSENNTAKIIDFGIATELSREKQNLSTNILKGSLPFISPEQTGRMNRAIDYRTDFYSLGVTLYKLLSGKLPFDVEDDNPMTWIHCHIAREPKLLTDIDPAISAAISAIILKLMAKNAEDRYQSAFAINNDFEICYQQWQEYGVIGEIALGQQDISDRFEIQQKLYGREQEVDRLLSAFSSTEDNASTMFLVSGFSGIGKSALINEVYKPIIAKHGYYISGKFDQFQRNIPYSAMAAAFRGLMKQLLTEPQSKLKVWKKQILEVLGPNGQVIIDFIPELEQIIGTQPKVSHLGTEENQNRFNQLTLSFLHLFTQNERPLVLFIDDLQWIDSASLNLIKLFMMSKEHTHFLFIGAYRDNEVDEHHPFVMVVDELKQAGVSIAELILQPLKLNHINNLIADSLYTHEEKTLPLAQLVLDKTAGNPFFINQFLKNIYETECLTFDFKEKAWVWNLEEIKQQQSADNVVDLVVAKMSRLPKATRELLKLSACIGNIFDLHTLAIISEQNLVHVARNLWPAVQSGLLLTDGDEHVLLKGMDETEQMNATDYSVVLERFLHDRVQQAAYSLIDQDQKQQIHLRIARLLLQKIPEAEIENHYFDIVGHYNQSISLLEDANERARLAELNLKVGIKAKDATAYFPALEYFNHADLCLQAMESVAQDRLRFAIDKGRIECHFLLSEVEQGLELANKVISRSSEIEDKVELNNLLILYYGGAGQMDKAIDIALESLRYFEVILPRNPTMPQLLIELATAKINLGRKSTEDLMRLPLIKDENIDIVFSLLKELIAPTYLQGLNNLLPFIILRMFNLTLKHGNGSVASFAYSGYALLWSKLDDFAESYRFGILAMDYNKKVDNPPMEARCYFMATSFALYWRQPLVESQQPRKIGLQKLIDTGEYFWASYIYLFGFWQELVLSKSLDDVFTMTAREIKFSAKAKQVEPYYVHILHRNLFKNLAGLSENSESLDFDGDNEAQATDYFNTNITSTMGKFYHVVCRLILHFYYEQYQQAIEIATRVDINNDVIRDGTFTRVIYTFFTCLSALALASTSTQPVVFDKQYSKRKAKIKQWYLLFPENFSCMWHLILAQEAGLKSRNSQAIENYQEALLAAKQNQSLFYESLVNELYAKFWIQCDNNKVAAVYMVEAGYLYYRWGAVGKQNYLEKQYPELFTNLNLPVKHSSNTLTTEETYTENFSDNAVTTNKGSALDLNTLVQASQALSSEIVMEKLLQKLMHFMIENAGAQKGILILKEQDKFFIETECSVEKGKEVMNSQPVALAKSTNLSQAIVLYVTRSHELLVLDDAENNEQFSADKYLQKNHIKSVLCLPLLEKGEIIGILYLENNLANNTFTPDRVETLQVLSAEIGISLQNARLYRSLEQYNQTLEDKVKERTSVLRSVNDALQTKNIEIQQSKEIIEEKNSNITKSIQYAQKIQQAMLPQNDRIAEQFADFFIIYKPKQIVSGDFYWFNKVDEKLFFIVADCTGHGVPGAFLSMIGNTLLNKIIIEKSIHSPAKILTVLHEEMKIALKQSDQNRHANDGMDVALCKIEPLQETLVFSGARRPLYLFENKSGNLIKIKGDRKSIGGRQKELAHQFTDHELSYTIGDMVYLSSDGFVDQHNLKGKKFGSLRLESTLQKVAKYQAIDQKQQILTFLEDHQGNEPQRDDITVMGIKLNKIQSKNNTISQEKK